MVAPVAVAAGDIQTVEAAASMLRAGGTAADAAVAGILAALVAEPGLINLGGGGLALVREPTGLVGYDFMADMPSRPPYPGMDFYEVVVQFEASSQSFWLGRASVAVPGLIAGLYTLHQRHGRLPWATLFEPAIRLAREGAVLSEAQVTILRLLRGLYERDPKLRARFVPNGEPPKPGTRLRRPDLARTLELLAREGPDAFYRGPLAEAILADQAEHGGLLTREDLARYQVRQVQPLARTYRGHRVWLPDLPSRGGGLVAFTLALLEDYALGQAPFPWHLVDHLRLLLEAMRLTEDARPLWEDLNASSEERRRRLFEAHLPRARAALRAALAGSPDAQTQPLPERPFTTHISVLDREERLVSMTVTAGEDAGFIVGDTGMRLNNMLGEADLHPQGFHKMRPGERLGTMMTPVIAHMADGGWFAVGSGGSSRIRSAVLQTFSAVADFHLTLTAAVQAPRVHYEAGICHLEGGIPAERAEALARLGYRVNLWPTRSMYFGGAHAVYVRAGEAQAAGDPRRGGAGWVDVF